MIIKTLVSGVLICLPWSGSLAQELPDISALSLETFKETFNCSAPSNDVEKHACTTIDMFETADTPDLNVFKQATVSKNVRLLGVASVFGESEVPGEQALGDYAHFYLAHFEARKSANFHEKVWFADGATAIYIWPTREQEKQIINSAVETLLNGTIDRDNAAISYALKTDFGIDKIKTSMGKSLLVSDSTSYLRQSGNTLVLLYLTKGDSGRDKYLVSAISLESKL